MQTRHQLNKLVIAISLARKQKLYGDLFLAEIAKGQRNDCKGLSILLSCLFLLNEIILSNISKCRGCSVRCVLFPCSIDEFVFVFKHDDVSALKIN